MAAIGGFEIPGNEIEFTFSRSSGAGGQNVNKVSSKATLHWNLGLNATVPESVKSRFKLAYANRLSIDGVLILHSEQFRDQPKNKEACLNKFGSMLRAVGKVPKRRIGTKPTKASIERRVQTKKRVGTKKKQRKVIDRQSFQD